MPENIGNGTGGVAGADTGATKDGDIKPTLTLAARGGLSSRQGTTNGSRPGRTRATVAAASATAMSTATTATTIKSSKAAKTIAAAITTTIASSGEMFASATTTATALRNSIMVDKNGTTIRHDGNIAQQSLKEEGGGLPVKTSTEGWNGSQSGEETVDGTGEAGRCSPGTRWNQGGAPGKRGGTFGSRKEPENVETGSQRAQDKSSSDTRTFSVAGRGVKRSASGGRASGKRGGGDAGEELPGKGGKGERGGVSKRAAGGGDFRGRGGHGNQTGGQGSAQAAINSTRALGDRERQLLDVFLR